MERIDGKIVEQKLVEYGIAAKALNAAREPALLHHIPLPKPGTSVKDCMFKIERQCTMIELEKKQKGEPTDWSIIVIYRLEFGESFFEEKWESRNIPVSCLNLTPDEYEIVKTLVYEDLELSRKFLKTHIQLLQED